MAVHGALIKFPKVNGHEESTSDVGWGSTVIQRKPKEWGEATGGRGGTKQVRVSTETRTAALLVIKGMKSMLEFSECSVFREQPLHLQQGSQQLKHKEWRKCDPSKCCLSLGSAG